MNNIEYIIGIDGGGSSTEGIIFSSDGNTLSKLNVEGTNLYVYKEKAIKSIIKLIDALLKNVNIDYSDISAIGLGLSGVSDLSMRDLLLRELDKIGIGDRSLVVSDIETAYQLLCPKGHGILVSVGTGIVCMGRNEEGKSIKVAGKGYDKGDIGSGFWIGKKIINYILLNQSTLSLDRDIKDIYKLVMQIFNISNIISLNEVFNDESDIVYKTALLAEGTIKLASEGNDVALSVIQEATTNVAEYIIYLIDEIGYKKNDIMISAHGSIIRNEYYRQLLNDALQFDLHNIRWILSDVSTAYIAGILSAKCRDITLSINDIVKNIN